MHKLYLGLGSNLGNRIQNIQKAIEMIDEQVGAVYRISTFMETAPVGFCSENRFINVVCLVHTHFLPIAVWKKRRGLKENWDASERPWTECTRIALLTLTCSCMTMWKSATNSSPFPTPACTSVIL